MRSERRDIAPSHRVLLARSRALELTAPEQEHLLLLAGRTPRTRYLAEGGIWFDDEAVPHKDAQGGYVTV